MILDRHKETSAINYGTLAIAFVYYGERLVWQAVSSCYGAGYWIEDYPWSATDAWRDNT